MSSRVLPDPVQGSISTVLNYFSIGLALFLIIYDAMGTAENTKDDDEEKPPMFCCCYSWEVPKMEMPQMDLKGQDVIEDDYVNDKR